ncbi:hypothetical protein OFR22_09680 [Brachyspira hyodysenteriae]|uniref:Uncharacterized protein n=1 Tax=Brachyspira hyodysenteriae (strain ATCC 49526 / WA1) TaxID=565034 RepID=A0A3B6VEQ9_BRAHW|nr:hypothetical protein [Brachyspira hyodysenteriae]ACN84793.1 hypothetical protein BHWA1_02339 [Brachyspira hyodysenteriae WA1]AUJ50521.1 hypothetical protein BH718_02091 [Brachyspira hyodysenteriae]MBT8719824.1 hypothetical protein [Brachyspira hyodysenteriae]MBT8730063.1 hypothetical protein [Brachyspira hyodysenteriae]MBT8732485.1 hypothetical protein [Brachyspira hyodysenteriae]
MSNININLLLLIGFILLAIYSITTRIVNNRANKDKKENDTNYEDNDSKE